MDDDCGPGGRRRLPRRIELINSAGRTYTAAFTLYYGLLNLITDRTQADVDFVRQLAAKGWAAMTAEERAAWKGGLKGAYNASDLNRVGSAVEYVANRLREAGYIVTVHPRTGWTEELPIAQNMYAYLSDVKAIRGVLPLPELPTLPRGYVPPDLHRRQRNRAGAP